MTGIKIVCVGRVKEDFFRDGIAAYVKEIRKKYSMDIMECPDEPTPDQCPASVERQIREMEGERILSKIKDDDYVIALCIDGKHYSTSAWKKRMERVFSTVSSDVVFVIGGSSCRKYFLNTFSKNLTQSKKKKIKKATYY